MKAGELGGTMPCDCPGCGERHAVSVTLMELYPSVFRYCPACSAKRDKAERLKAEAEKLAAESAKEAERIRQAMVAWSRMAPAEFRELTLAGLLRGVGVAPAVSQVVEWEPTADKPWLLLAGGSGTGKTSAVWLLLRKFAERGMRAKVYSSGEFADAAVEAQMDGTASDMRRELRGAEVLVLDDLDKEVLRERAQEMLFYALNARYAARLPVVITTNDDWSGLERQWPDAETGAAAVRRMKQKSLVIPFVGGRKA